jgi:predicted molibdopterin-dependent oxidoreductase YjgC
VAGLAAAFGSGAMTNSIAEIENSKCIFIIGSNTSEAHPLIGSRILNARERGAKLIVADPRRIQLSSKNGQRVLRSSER